MIAKLKQYRISPKKANLVASLVRKKNYTDAINILKFTNKKAALALKKLIESAGANATHNLNQTKDSLYIKEIIVSEGPTYKRHIPISRGRVHPIKKRTSHIIVKLASFTPPETTPTKSVTEKPTKAKTAKTTTENSSTPKTEKKTLKPKKAKAAVKKESNTDK